MASSRHDMNDETQLRRITEPLLSWYDANARKLPWREAAAPYHVWVSEIMLQQTRVAAAIPYYERFIRALPDIPALAAAPEELLHKLWEGLGYYRRAQNMRRAAAEVMERFGGALPASFDELQTLTGVGRYTAGAIASIAYGISVPAVDGNALRVLSRVLNDPGDIASPTVKRLREEQLLSVMPERPGAFNQAIMDLGATLCLPSGQPKCAECPIHEHCRAFAAGTQSALPVKKPRTPRRVMERTVFLIIQRAKSGPDRVALQKRPAKGLLAGLYELPGEEGRLCEQEAAVWLKERGLPAFELAKLQERKHVFTHVEWRMTGYRVTVPPGPQAPMAWEWVKDLGAVALPSAFKGFLKELT